MFLEPESAISVEKPKEEAPVQAPVEDVKPALPPSPVVEVPVPATKAPEVEENKKQSKRAAKAKKQPVVSEQVEPMDVTPPLPVVEVKPIEKPVEQPVVVPTPVPTPAPAPVSAPAQVPVSAPAVPAVVEAVVAVPSVEQVAVTEMPTADAAAVPEAAADKGSKSKKGKGKKNKKE